MRARALTLSLSLSLSLHTQAHTKRFAHTHARTHTHTHTQKHTITLARTTHAHARHACSMTLGERVCVRQGVSVCVLWPPSTLSGTLSTHLHSSTCPQRNPYTRRRLRCRHSDRQPGHLVILRYKRMRAVAYARCIALFVLLVPALRTPAVIPLALAASRIRACMQQDATGSLGTCVHKRMRACQHMLRSAGEKGGSAADTLSTHLSHLSTCPRRTGCTSRQMMK